MIKLADAKRTVTDGLRLYAVNVGKADCLLLLSGSTCYMIDTGSKDSWPAVISALKRLNITSLNGVIITHTDKDHSGGAAALAKCGIPVAHWYTSAFFTGIKKKKHPVIRAASTAACPVEWLSGGAVLPLQHGSLTVLGPLAPSEKENNNSVVLLAETPDGSILLTGDMEFDEESALLEAGLLHRVDVLKVAHHAQSDATSTGFLQAIRPRIALISTSTLECPSTPSSKVMRLLKAAGTSAFLTDQTVRGMMITLKAGKITVTAN